MNAAAGLAVEDRTDTPAARPVTPGGANAARWPAVAGGIATVIATVIATAALIAGLARGDGWGAVVDAGELAASAAATGLAWRAARSGIPAARSWRWLAAGFGGWAFGAAVWAVQSEVLGRDVPVPSIADAGFLLLLPCVATGLVLRPGARAGRRSQRMRLLLDEATMLLSLLLIAWPFAYFDVREAGPTLAEQVTILTYPLGDVLLVTLVAALLMRAGGAERRRLAILLAGFLALTAADGCFTYYAGAGSTTTVTVADPLWIAGFALLGIAAWRAGREGGLVAVPSPEGWSPLPYVLVVAAGAAATVRWLLSGRIDTPAAGIFAVLTVLVYLRQHLMLRDHRRLLAELAARREQLRTQELIDPLTGLANRRAFRDHADRALEGPGGAATPYTVVKLRPADPTLLGNLGPDDQDRLLAGLASRIAGCLRPDDVLSRVAEATFAVLRPGDLSEGYQLALRAMHAMEEPVELEGSRWHVQLAVGIAAAAAPAGRGGGAPAITGSELLQQAAVALNSIDSPAGGVATFDQRLLHAYVQRVELREALAREVRAGATAAVDVLCEPVVDLGTGALAGVAMRAGWNHPVAGTLSDERLADLARQAGLTAEIDATLAAKAVAAFGTWLRRWPRNPCDLWLTVSAGSLDDDFAGRLEGLLERAGVPLRRLILDPVMTSNDPGPTGEATALERLRRLGCRVAINDVLSAPEPRAGAAEVFQIPPFLVDRCTDDVRAHRLIQATIEFAHGRAASSSARNVVSAEQHEELRSLGCDVARGPLYGAGVDVAAMGELLAEAAGGGYRAPVLPPARRSRSSAAWRELRTVVSGLPVATMACTADGTIVLAEGGLFEKLGIRAGQLLGRQVREVMGRRLGGQVALDAVLGGEPQTETLQLRGHWVETHLHPVYGPAGEVTGVMGVSIDVTDRMQAEAAMRESEQRFRAIFDDAPVGVALVGSDACIQEVNNALAAMLGFAPADLLGRTLQTLWHPDSPATTQQEYESLRSGRAPTYRAERAYRHRDGSPVWTRVTVGPLPGSPGMVVGIVEDLREVKALEVELRHAQKLEAVGRLAAGIAHEINTPTQFVGDNLAFLADAFATVAGLLAATGRLSSPVDEAAARELEALTAAADLPWLEEEIPSAITQSQDGVRRVATIVQAMRNFGHPDRRDPTPIDINGAIRDTVTVARNEYKYVADLELDLSDVPAVLGFPSEFHQVILNLVVNAAHAIVSSRPPAAGRPAARGRIIIRSWADGQQAHVSVSDDGCGIPADTRARIFEPFFTTKPVGQGTGQGLAIVHSVIVDKHRGGIDVDSEPGAGCTFTLHLPLLPASDGS